jgi:hypothetical protein
MSGMSSTVYRLESIPAGLTIAEEYLRVDVKLEEMIGFCPCCLDIDIPDRSALKITIQEEKSEE